MKLKAFLDEYKYIIVLIVVLIVLLYLSFK